MSSKKKISFKASEAIIKKFNDEISDLPLAKDQLLNNLIKNEVEHLAKAMKDKVLLDETKTYISNQLKAIKGGLKPVSVLLDEDVIIRLDSVIKKTNIVRDAFINRVIFIFLYPSVVKKLVENDYYDGISFEEEINKTGESISIAETKENLEYSLKNVTRISPIKWLELVLNDPFYILREELNRTNEVRTLLENPEEDLYLFSMPEQWVGLTCYAKIEDLPGSNAYKKMQDDMHELLKDF